MMKAWLRSSILWGVLLMAFQGIAAAEIIQGRLLKVDAKNNEIVLASDSELATQGQALILVYEDTVFDGAASLEALHPGQEIAVEVEVDTVVGLLNALGIRLVPESVTDGEAAAV